ncbi:ankyrin repeat protein [Rutstroemia sp. NJR-2017a WRK4]|nr:ankyrin repeat protein [Rutstroemia sp. NJR-2017a WRK4]
MTLPPACSSTHHIPITTTTTNSQLQTRPPTVSNTNKLKRHMATSFKSYGLVTCQSYTITFSKPGSQVVVDGNDNRMIPDEESEIEIHYRWLPKVWLFSTGISLVRNRKYGNWKYSMRPIHIVSWSSPLFMACMDHYTDPKEQINKVIELVKSGKGSLFDTTSWGATLLHEAAKNLRPELCRWLLAQGLQGDERDTRNETALHYAAVETRMFPIDKKCSTAYDTIRVLVELGQCDPASTYTQYEGDPYPRTPLHCYSGPLDAFLYMLDQEIFPTSLELPNFVLSVVQDQIMHNCAASSITAEMLRIRYDLSSEDIACIKDPVYTWYMLNRQLIAMWDMFSYCSEDEVSGITSLLREVLKAGIDVYALNKESETPFSHSFLSIFYLREEDCIDALPRLLSVWFGLLRETGYDLQDYLRRESQTWPKIRRSCYADRAIQDIHIEKHINSLDLTFSLQIWDLQDAVRLNWKPGPKQKPPGAWIDSREDEVDEFITWFKVFKQQVGRPQWEPDLEM